MSILTLLRKIPKEDVEKLDNILSKVPEYLSRLTSKWLGESRPFAKIAKKIHD